MGGGRWIGDRGWYSVFPAAVGDALLGSGGVEMGRREL